MFLSVAELEEIRDFLVSVAKEAGQVITSANPSTAHYTTKQSTTDLVTETDQAVENLIATRLIAQYPTFDFIGEETFTPSSGIPPGPTFLVDPIDGTTNFLHSFPSVAVSLALVHHRRPAVGVVYNPFLDELFTAVRGAGAFRSFPASSSPPHPLPLLSPPPPLRGLAQACIGLDPGTARDGHHFALNCRVFAALAASPEQGGRDVRALRVTGSAAETICRVAAGQQDAFWEAYGCGPWDFAAAWCVLSEAGGVLVDALPVKGGGGWPPEEVRIEGGRVLAVRAAGEGQRGFVEEFWGVVGGEGGWA